MDIPVEFTKRTKIKHLKELDAATGYQAIDWIITHCRPEAMPEEEYRERIENLDVIEELPALQAAVRDALTQSIAIPK